MIILWKSQNESLVFGLTHKEFQCKCNFESCRFTIVSPRLTKAYEKFRIEVGLPLYITSGFRCQRHHYENVYDKNILRLTASRHLIGMAIDISVANLLDTYDIGDIISIAKDAGFTCIYYNEDEQFIHCDVRGAS